MTVLARIEGREVRQFDDLSAFQTDRRHFLDARNGSILLRDAILRAKGHPVPEKPRKVAVAPRPQPSVVPLPERSSSRLLVSDIQKIVAAYYRIPEMQMTGDSRRRRLVHVRQVAMYLSTELTKQSIAEIGRRFNRDHTTILHAVKRIEAGMEEDSRLKGDVSLLRMKLEA